MPALWESKQAVDIARSALDGRMPILEAAREMASLAGCDWQLRNDEDEKLFIAVASETDNLPVGNVRKLWDSAVLAEKDSEINRCEELWGWQLRAACERLLSRSASERTAPRCEETDS